MSQGYFFGRLPQWKAEFHKAQELPFSELLSAKRIEGALEMLGCTYRNRIYPPDVTLWMFLSQVLSPDHSCRDAVARNLAYRRARGLSSCSTDTSSYCQARIRLPEALIANLARDTGRELSEQAPEDWFWNGRRVKDPSRLWHHGLDARYGGKTRKVFGDREPSNRRRDRADFQLCECSWSCVWRPGPRETWRWGRTAANNRESCRCSDRLLATFRKSEKSCWQTGCFASYCVHRALHGRGVDAVFRLNAHRQADFRRGGAFGERTTTSSSGRNLRHALCG